MEKNTEWYAASTGNHQGLVCDRADGRNVAVTYDSADAPLVAAAPRLRQALSDMCEMASHHAMPESEAREIMREARMALSELRDAIAAAAAEPR